MKILILIFVAVLLFFIMVMVIDCHRFVIKEYTYTSAKIKKDATFVLISDLHNKAFGKENEKLLKAIDKLSPDVILSAGDMYTASKTEDNAKAAEFVCRLASKYPFFGGNGNHEHKTRLYPDVFGSLYEDYMKKVKESGAVILVNEKLMLSEYGVCLYGLELDRKYYQKFTCLPMDEVYLSGVLGKPDPENVNLLIAHNPDYFEDYAKWGADLVVSGHVHGGLMKLPVIGGVISPRLCLFPHYDGGRFEKGSSTMILGRGLGTHTLPIRIFNPGELVVIRMKRCR